MYPHRKPETYFSFTSSVWLASTPLQPPLCVRIWGKVRAALHESRSNEAQRVIRSYRHLCPDAQGIQLPPSGRARDRRKVSRSSKP
jgi:hypothetical protein